MSVKRGSGAEGHAARKPRRFSKRTVRTWAWVAGSASFLTFWASIGANPNPPALAAKGNSRPPRKHIIVRKTIRRVVIHEAAPQAAQVVYVSAPGGSSSGGSSSGGGSSSFDRRILNDGSVA